MYTFPPSGFLWRLPLRKKIGLSPAPNINITNRSPVHPDLPVFRHRLVVLFCQLSLGATILSTLANITTGVYDEMLFMSLGVMMLAAGLLWSASRSPKSSDRPALGLLLLGSLVVASGWFPFGGVLGSGPSLLYPLAGFSLLFSTLRAQRLALLWVILLAMTLVTFHVLVPGAVSPYYASEEVRLLDVATSHVIGVSLAAVLFHRLASHHLLGWEEFGDQQHQNLELIRHHAERTEQDLHDRLQLTDQLGCNLAHDVNNLLTVVLIGAQCLDESVDAELRDDIIDSARAASQLVNRFRNKSTEVHQPIDVKEVLKTLERSVQRLAPQIDVQLRLPRQTTRVLAARVDLEQVILNLCLNGIHAMAQSGQLVVELQVQADGVAEVSVTDTGCGIGADVLERIFEPFFTTRSKEGGTGVGLANVRATVEGWGGDIRVESRLGQGSCFTLTIPTTLSADDGGQST